MIISYLRKLCMPLVLLSSLFMVSGFTSCMVFEEKSTTIPDSSYSREFQYSSKIVYDAGLYALMQEGFSISESNLQKGTVVGINPAGLIATVKVVPMPYWDQEITKAYIYIIDQDGVVYPDVTLYMSLLNKMREFMLS